MGQAASKLASISLTQSFSFRKKTQKLYPAERPDPSGKCHLLDLPAELRNIIYRFVLVEEVPIDILRYEPRRSRGPIPAADAALTRTCRAISQETLSIFYGENVFRCPSFALDRFSTMDQWPVIRWLRWIRSERRELLGHVRIQLGFANARSNFPVKPSERLKIVAGWTDEVAPEVKNGVVSFVRHESMPDEYWEELFEDDEMEEDRSLEEASESENESEEEE